MEELEIITINEIEHQGLKSILVYTEFDNKFVPSSSPHIKLLRTEDIKVIDCQVVMDFLFRKFYGHARDCRGSISTGTERYQKFPFEKIKLMIIQIETAQATKNTNDKLIFKLVSTINELRDRVELLERKSG